MKVYGQPWNDRRILERRLLEGRGVTGGGPGAVERRAFERRLQADGFEPARRPLLVLDPLDLPSGRGPVPFYDGRTPAPGTTHTNAAQPVNAPFRGDPSERSREAYDAAINQFAVAHNPRYAIRDSSGNGVEDTFCNIFAWDVTRAMGAEIPHWVDGQGNPSAPGAHGAFELDANGTNTWLNVHGQAHGWRRVTAEEAQRLANEGHPAVASWKNPSYIGHIAVVRPGEAKNGPAIAQSGTVNTNGAHVYDTFRRDADVQYFVNARGTPAQIAPPAPPRPTGDPAVIAQVEDAYRTHLRRDSDPEGLLNWNAAAQALHAQGRPAEELQRWLDAEFGGSPEAQALRLVDEAFVEVHGRDVSGDRGYWHEDAVRMMRDEGRSPDEVRAHLRHHFQNSPEFRLRGVDGVVDGAFEAVLGRTPDAPGYWHQTAREWVEGGASLEEVQARLHDEFSRSDEYFLGHPGELVASLYREHLGREPDDHGGPMWTADVRRMFDEGKSVAQARDYLTAGIQGSAEYQARIAPAAPGGVDPAKAARLDGMLRASGLEGKGGQMLAMAQKYGVPVELALAMFWMEAQWNTEGIAPLNNNPGNLRFVGQPGAVSGVSNFARWSTVEEGIEAYFKLMNDVYRPFIDRGDWQGLVNKYAPPSDGNDSVHYANTISRLMVSYRDRLA